MMRLKLNCGLIIILCLMASRGWTDTLELKNGSLIKGKFIGGTETEITFQVGFRPSFLVPLPLVPRSK